MYDHNCFPFFSMPHGLGWVFMILFWVLAISGVIAMVRWLSAGTARREPDMSLPAHKTPADILRERYARGDIDREEFMQRLGDLNEH